MPKTAAKKNLKPLAAVETNSKILEFFSTAAKEFFFECQKLRQKKLKPLAAVEKNSKILEIFSTAAKDFFFGCQKLRQKNLKPLTAVEKKSKILDFFSTAAKDFVLLELELERSEILKFFLRRLRRQSL